MLVERFQIVKCAVLILKFGLGLLAFSRGRLRIQQSCRNVELLLVLGNFALELFLLSVELFHNLEVFE